MALLVPRALMEFPDKEAGQVNLVRTVQKESQAHEESVVKMVFQALLALLAKKAKRVLMVSQAQMGYLEHQEKGVSQVAVAYPVVMDFQEKRVLLANVVVQALQVQEELQENLDAMVALVFQE